MDHDIARPTHRPACSCLLCLPAPAEVQEEWKWEIGLIEQGWWPVIGVTPCENDGSSPCVLAGEDSPCGSDEHPPWAYTVGLWHLFRQPEYAVVGLDVRTATAVLNAVGALARLGEAPVAGQPLGGVLGHGHSLVAKEVHPSWYGGLLSLIPRFYPLRAPPAHQLVWPEVDGRWPWDTGIDPVSRDRQPRLWLPVDEQPGPQWPRLVAGL
jgi:hypothetical protein